MGDPTQVKALIKSINSHSGFRQMAEYNLNCLMSHITPPAVGWRENVQVAVQENGIDSIIKVLSKHGKSPDMVLMASGALTGLATSKANAGMIAQGGGVETALQSMLNITDSSPGSMEVVNSGAKLLETVARFNPEAIGQSAGTIDSILKGLNFDKNERVQTASAKVLDRVAMKPAGLDMIVAQGGIESIINSIGPGKNTHEGMLTSTFRLMERLAKNPDYVEKMRELGGVEALVSQLEAHGDNEFILRAGGRLLAKIAEGDIQNALARLANANISPEAREFAMGLIANLALQPDKVDEIVQNGGVPKILDGLTEYNEKTQVAALRALQRVADSGAQNAEEIVNNGGVPKIIKVLESADGDEERLKAATAALMAIAAANPDFVGVIDQEGGVEAVLNGLRNNPNLDGFALQALEFLEQIAKGGYPIEKLIQNGGVEAVIATMRANPDNEDIQAQGLATLKQLMNASGDAENAAVATELVRVGGPQLMVQALKKHKNNDAVVKNGVGAISRFIRNEKNGKAHIANSDGVNASVDAIFTQQQLEMLGKSRLSHNPEYTRDVRALLSDLIPAAEVKGLKSSINSEEGMKKAAVYSLDGKFANMMSSNGIPQAMGKVVESLVDNQSFDDLETAAVAVWALGKSSHSTMTDLLESGAVDAELRGIKSYPAQADSTNALLRGLNLFATAGDCKKALIDKGCIEACRDAMSSNAANPEVLTSAVELMLSLCTTDDFSAKVAQKGGVQQMNKMIDDSAQNEEFETPIEKSLELQHRIANLNNNPKMLTQLKKQGTVTSVTNAMAAFPQNNKILEYGARVLGLLMDKDDVAKVFDDVAVLTEDLNQANRPEKAERIFKKLATKGATAGFLALNPENKEIINDKQGTRVLMNATQTGLTKAPSNARAVSSRNTFRAFGQVANATSSPPGTNQALVNYLKDEETVMVPEKVGVLEAIKTLADVPAPRTEFQNLGAIDNILDLLNEHGSEDALAVASLGALSALTADRGGVDLATKSGAADNIMNLLKSNNEHMSPEGVTQALDALTNLASSPLNIDNLFDNGILDLLNNLLDEHCGDPTKPELEVLLGAVNLLNKLGSDEDNMKKIVRGGAYDKVVEKAMSNPAYLADADIMRAIANLAEGASNIDDVRDRINAGDTVPMLMAGMNLNPNDDEMNEAAAKALQRLMKGNEKGLDQALNDYDKILKKTSKDPSPHNVEKLNNAGQQLNTLMLIDGVVDADGAAKIVDRVLDTIDVADKKIPDGPQKGGLLETALQNIGRAAAIDNALDGMDIDRLLDSLTKTLNNNLDNPMLLGPALAAIKTALNENPDLLKDFANKGGIKAIENVIQNTTDPEVKKQAKGLMQEVANLGAAKPDNLLGAANLDDSLIPVIRNIDPDNLDDLLRKLAEKPGGMNDLLNMLTRLDDDDLKMNILESLLNIDDSIAVPQSVMDTVVDRFQNGTAVQRAQALGVLSKTELTPQSAKKLLDTNATDNLMDILGRDGLKDPKAALDALNAISQMAKDPMLAKNLNDLGALDKIMKVLESHPENDEVRVAAFEALDELEKNGGLKPMAKDIQALDDLIEKLPSDRRDLGEDLVQRLTSQQGGDMDGLVVKRFDGMLGDLEKGDAWKELYDENGTPYYHNELTGETTWEKPAALVLVDDNLNKLANIAENSPADIENQQLESAVSHFDKHSAEPLRLKALAKALAALAANEANREAMANAGVLRAIIKALEGDNTDRDFLLAALALLNQFAKHKKYKEQIAKLNGIAAIIAIMLKYIDDQEIVDKCLIVLSNLAHGSALCVSEIMKLQGPEAVKRVLNKWPKDAPIITNAMILLSNLMSKNVPNKDTIGRVLRKEILTSLRLMYKDPKVFTNAARALGNISFIDDHTMWVCSKQAVKTLVTGMNANPSSMTCQQLAIDVMGNFASVDESSVQDDIDSGKIQSVLRTIEHEGGARKIVDTFESSEDTALLVSCIKTLSIMAEDDTVTASLVKMGVPKLGLDAMQKFDYDDGISEWTANLVQIMTCHKRGVDAIEEHDGVAILLQRLAAVIDVPELLAPITSALKNMAVKPSVRSKIRNANGIPAVIKAMQSNTTDAEFLVEAFDLLTRLSLDENEISEEIAQKGMHVILKCINRNLKDEDPEAKKVIITAFRTLGHLAFAKENLKIIVQYGGIPLIVGAILDDPANVDLCLQSVKTLDNIAMASPEYAKLVVEQKGLQAIQGLEDVYSTKRLGGQKGKDLVQACKSAALSMTQIKERKAKPKHFFDDRHALTDPSVDPLKEYRNMLKSGHVFTAHIKGSTKKRHVYLSRDYKTLEMKDPKKGKVLKSIPLMSIQGIREGVQKGHKKNTPQETAFGIKTKEDNYCFTANDAKQKEVWVRAFKALQETARSNKQWLRDA